MPKMSEVILLTHHLDSLGNHAPQQDSLVMLSSLLKKADKDMMHWMRNYKSPEQPYDTASIQYLQKEKLRVVQLKLDINNALQLARPYKK
jgi:succinate dehydrogenase flavin-adding protein (antitoxin of CptAB toxin-antitoxin module)